MTPKLYDEVNTKLVNTWGPYAGWAHSVNPTFTAVCTQADSSSGSFHGGPKVIFGLRFADSVTLCDTREDDA